MNQLNLAATRTTPSVILDPATRTLEIAGQSYPEDSIPFYRNIEEALDAYLLANHEPFKVVFKLDYFNTSSSKCILDLLDCLERSHRQHQNITVDWCYQEGDEDMMESGEDFSLEVKLPFNLIATPKSKAA